MRKRIISLVALGACIVALALTRRHCDRSLREVPQPGTVRASVPSEHGQMIGAPRWLIQPDVSARQVAGRVEYAGAPVTGAVVRLAVEHRSDILQQVAELRTDATGAFDFGLQPSAVFRLSAEAPDRTPAAVRVAVADPTVRSDRIILELRDCSARVYGSVLDVSGGAVPRARLTSAGLGGVDGDLKGQYSICVNQPRAVVRVTAAGYGPMEVEIIVSGALRYDFVLVPDAYIAGRVVGENQNPIPGASVTVSPDPASRMNHLAPVLATTDDSGRFSARGLAPGRYRLSAYADGLATATPQEAIAVAGATEREVTVVVKNSVVVKGHVMMDGRPAAGVRVVATRNGEPVSSMSYSQSDGSFVLTDVPIGTVSFVSTPFEVKSPTSLQINNSAVSDVTIIISKLASVRGRVLRRGKPVAGAEVACPILRKSVVANAEGQYVLEGLAAGQLRITATDMASKATMDVKTVMLAAGEDKTMDIDMDRSGEALGVVVDESGKPVPGVYVSMLSFEGSRDMAQSVTDVSGRFDCKLMIGGEYVISVFPSSRGGLPFTPVNGKAFARVQVPPDGAVNDIRLEIKDQRDTIRGVVIDELGAPVADASVVTPGPLRFADLPTTVTDVNGRFTITNLAPGTYRVRAYGSDGSEGEVADILSGDDNVSIVLQRPGTVDGELVGFSTPPSVQLSKLMPGTRVNTTALVNGDKFWQHGLPPGRYTVQATAGVEVDGTEVDVRPGETAHVVLHGRGVGRLEGRISELESKSPVAGMRCDAKLTISGPDANEAMQAISDADGHFAMSAPVGRVRVVCFSADPTLSISGGEVDVTPSGIASIQTFSVRSHFGAVRANAGFSLTPVTLPLTIAQVSGAAARQGLHVGDQLTAIDGEPTRGLLPMGVMFVVWNHRPGTTVALEVDRAGEALTFNIPVVDGF